MAKGFNNVERYWGIQYKELKPIYVDKYGFLTKKSITILKKHGNLILDLDVFKQGLVHVSMKKYKKRLFDPKTIETCSGSIYADILADCKRSLMDECERLVGFRCKNNVNIPEEDDHSTRFATILIEREDI